MTPYVVILHSEPKANKSNKYAVCRACIHILGKEAAYNNKFTNTKKECAHHFQNCPNFAATYTPEQIEEAAKDRAKSASNKLAKKWLHTLPDNSDDSDNSDAESDNEDPIQIQNANTLDNYIFHPLTESQVNKLEGHLLEVTVLCD